MNAITALINRERTSGPYRIEFDRDLQWSVLRGDTRMSSYYSTEHDAMSAMCDYRRSDVKKMAEEMLETLKFVQDRLRGDHECFQRVSDVIAKAEGIQP